MSGGKYDKECEELAKKLNANVALLVSGTDGNGFSVTGNFDFQNDLPKLLRELADNIEKTHQHKAIRYLNSIMNTGQQA